METKIKLTKTERIDGNINYAVTVTSDRFSVECTYAGDDEAAAVQVYNDTVQRVRQGYPKEIVMQEDVL